MPIDVLEQLAGLCLLALILLWSGARGDSRRDVDRGIVARRGARDSSGARYWRADQQRRNADDIHRRAVRGGEQCIHCGLRRVRTVALIRTALEPRQFGWLRRSAALEQLERSAAMLLETLAEESHMPAAEKTEASLQWKHRFASALPRLREAGLQVGDDVEAGAAEYVRLRSGWNAPVNGLADFLGHPRHQIDVSDVMPAHGKD